MSNEDDVGSASSREHYTHDDNQPHSHYERDAKGEEEGSIIQKEKKARADPEAALQNLQSLSSTQLSDEPSLPQTSDLAPVSNSELLLHGATRNSPGGTVQAFKRQLLSLEWNSLLGKLAGGSASKSKSTLYFLGDWVDAVKSYIDMRNDVVVVAVAAVIHANVALQEKTRSNTIMALETHIHALGVLQSSILQDKSSVGRTADLVAMKLLDLIQVRTTS